MKTIILLVVIGLLFSCRPASYVPTMPNEPMFTKPLEAQTGIALGFDHIEAQGAVSLLPFAGVSAGFYKGKRKTQVVEYGVNFFWPVNTQKNIFVSISAGRGEGRNDRSYHHNFLYTHESYFIKNTFSNFYIQPGVYCILNADKVGRFKLGLAFKYQEIFFKTFNIQFNTKSSNTHYTYEIQEKKDRGYGITQTPFINFQFIPDDSPVYMQLQAGYTFITESFTTELLTASGGGGWRDSPLKDLTHPLFNPLLINFSVGLKIN